MKTNYPRHQSQGNLDNTLAPLFALRRHNAEIFAEIIQRVRDNFPTQAEYNDWWEKAPAEPRAWFDHCRHTFAEIIFNEAQEARRALIDPRTPEQINLDEWQRDTEATRESDRPQ